MSQLGIHFHLSQPQLWEKALFCKLLVFVVARNVNIMNWLIFPSYSRSLPAPSLDHLIESGRHLTWLGPLMWLTLCDGEAAQKSGLLSHCFLGLAEFGGTVQQSSPLCLLLSSHQFPGGWEGPLCQMPGNTFLLSVGGSWSLSQPWHTLPSNRSSFILLIAHILPHLPPTNRSRQSWPDKGTYPNSTNGGLQQPFL